MSGLEGKSIRDRLTEEEILGYAEMSESLMQSPKHRTAFQRILKDANPNLSIPELEIEERVAARVKPLAEETAALKAKDAARESERQQEVLYENLRDARVIANRSEFGELVKYAAEKGFQTNDVGLKIAAAHRDSERELAEPTPQNAATSILPSNFKDIMKDPTGWARKTANDAFRTIVKNRGRAAAS